MKNHDIQIITQEQIERYADMAQERVKKYCSNTARTYEDVYIEIRTAVLSESGDDLFQIDQHVPATMGRPAHRVMCEIFRRGYIKVGKDAERIGGKNGTFSESTMIAA